MAIFLNSTLWDLCTCMWERGKIQPLCTNTKDKTIPNRQVQTGSSEITFWCWKFLTYHQTIMNASQCTRCRTTVAQDTVEIQYLSLSLIIIRELESWVERFMACDYEWCQIPQIVMWKHHESLRFSLWPLIKTEIFSEALIRIPLYHCIKREHWVYMFKTSPSFAEIEARQRVLINCIWNFVFMSLSLHFLPNINEQRLFFIVLSHS